MGWSPGGARIRAVSRLPAEKPALSRDARLPRAQSRKRGARRSAATALPRDPADAEERAGDSGDRGARADVGGGREVDLPVWPNASAGPTPRGARLNSCIERELGSLSGDCDIQKMRDRCYITASTREPGLRRAWRVVGCYSISAMCMDGCVLFSVTSSHWRQCRHGAYDSFIG